jgi:hypothetical protein
MSRRWKILIFVALVLGLAVLISIIHHCQLRAATEAYIAQLKAQGEPMELAQVLPPPVSAEQNSADIFRKAAALIDDSLSYSSYVYGMEMVAPGKAMVRWRQPDVRDSDGTNSWESVAEAVNENAQSFALLRQIIAKPNFNFQINYDQGVADLNFTDFYLAESKRAAQRLETGVICDLHRGETALAVTNSELVRIAIANIALNGNWEVLQSTNLTDEQLAELQNDWTSLDFIRSGEKALQMERLTGEITLNKWRKSNAELRREFDLGRKLRNSMGPPEEHENLWDKAKMISKIFTWQYWWSYPDEARSLKGYEILLETERSAETNDSFQTALKAQAFKLASLGIDKLDDEFFYIFDPEKTDMHSMLSQSIKTLSGTVRRVMMAETAKNTIITAIALKRYQLKHGSYPPELSSLVPEFVPKVPLDPVDGQPLRYRRNADGTFLLYSVGENGKDDGGNPASEQGVESSKYYWQNHHALDWVWPQPATPKEIQNYYAHPPK